MATPIPQSIPVPDAVTFRAHAEAWLSRAARDWKPATRAVYTSVTRADLVAEFGDEPLADLSRGRIRTGLDRIEARGLSASSMIRARALVQMILGDAVERDLLPYNPARDVRTPKRTRVRKLVVPRATDLEQLRTAAKRLPVEREMFFAILDGSALRVGECQALRPDDFEPSHGRLRVARTVKRTPRTGADDFTDAPKNGKTRFVDLPDSLCRDLAAFVATRRESDWLFPGRFDGPITYPPIAADFRAIARDAGLVGMTIHGYRHARISAWIAAGADLEWVRRQAGHHSMSYLLQVYGHHVPMRRQAVLADLPVARVIADEAEVRSR